MKPYVAISCLMFAVVLALHLWRLSVEGAAMLADPYFAASSAVTLVMTLWGAAVLIGKGAR